MQYKIVVGTSSEELAYNVNQAMTFGWRPYGIVYTEVKEAIGYEGWESMTYYAQPMVMD